MAKTAVRAFSIEHDVGKKLEKIPKGERSRFVNRAIRHAWKSRRDMQMAVAGVLLWAELSTLAVWIA